MLRTWGSWDIDLVLEMASTGKHFRIAILCFINAKLAFLMGYAFLCQSCATRESQLLVRKSLSGNLTVILIHSMAVSSI